MARIRLLAPALVAAGTSLVVALGGTASATARQRPTYPTNSELRQVQLATFGCARENTAAECSRARALADPLMDHPLLSSFCKDSVWDVLQKAQTGPENSFQRRDAIDQAGERLFSLCQARSDPKPAAPTPQGPGPSGLGSGGASGFGVSPSRN